MVHVLAQDHAIYINIYTKYMPSGVQQFDNVSSPPNAASWTWSSAVLSDVEIRQRSSSQVLQGKSTVSHLPISHATANGHPEHSQAF